MDRLAGITAFVRVAESGGFTAAAPRLNLSTTTVSEQVQTLENALGVRLLNRTTRRVSLTEIGREYYERCAQILQELDEANSVASALQLTPRGQLRVYSHQAVSRFVVPTITGFLARYPEASVDLRTGHVMIDLVQEGFDLAINPFPPPDFTLVDDVWRRGGLSCVAPRPTSKDILRRDAPPTSPVTTACVTLTRHLGTTGPSLILAAARWSRAYQET